MLLGRQGLGADEFTLGLLEKSESQTKRLSYHNTFLGIAQYRRVLSISFWEGLH